MAKFKHALGTVCAVGVATISLSAPAKASAATGTMAVSATVIAQCVVGATPMVFGNYSGAEDDQTANVTVICTNGTPYGVALDNGTGTGATTATRQMSGPGSAELGYSIYSDSGHSAVWGAASGTNTVSGTGNGLLQTIPAYGEIPASQTPSPGAYTDTVTVTLSY